MSTELRLAALPTAARCARLLVGAQLERWRLGELEDTVSLVASELVANAVAATGTLEMPATYAALHDLDLAIVAIRLRLTPASLYVEVWDGDPSLPIPGDPGDLDESGRGLMLVTALAAEWGAYPADAATGGKVVWARIDIPHRHAMTHTNVPGADGGGRGAFAGEADQLRRYDSPATETARPPQMVMTTFPGVWPCS